MPPWCPAKCPAIPPTIAPFAQPDLACAGAIRAKARQPARTGRSDNFLIFLIENSWWCLRAASGVPAFCAPRCSSRLAGSVSWTTGALAPQFRRHSSGGKDARFCWNNRRFVNQHRQGHCALGKLGNGLTASSACILAGPEEYNDNGEQRQSDSCSCCYPLCHVRIRLTCDSLILIA